MSKRLGIRIINGGELAQLLGQGQFKDKVQGDKKMKEKIKYIMKRTVFKFLPLPSLIKVQSAPCPINL